MQVLNKQLDVSIFHSFRTPVALEICIIIIGKRPLDPVWAHKPFPIPTTACICLLVQGGKYIVRMTL